MSNTLDRNYVALRAIGSTFVSASSADPQVGDALDMTAERCETILGSVRLFFL